MQNSLCFVPVVLPVRSDKSDAVLIFDLRRRRFLCVDLKGGLYSSVSARPEKAYQTGENGMIDDRLFLSRQRLKDRRGCLFRRVWSDAGRHRALLLSVGGGRLLTLEGAETSARRRRRRSQEVNPSDPLQSQPHPSHPVRDHKDADPGQPEQDQSGAVSKETITSCDDPLRVLRPNAPGSPVKTNIADRPEHD